MKPFIYLAGLWGGGIALEVAKQLEDMGWRDIIVYLVNTHIHKHPIKNKQKLKAQAVEYMCHRAEALIQEGYDKDYVEKVMGIAEIEAELLISSISRRLISTSAVLFQASLQADGNPRSEKSLDVQHKDISFILSHRLRSIRLKYHHDNIVNSTALLNKLREIL